MHQLKSRHRAQASSAYTIDVHARPICHKVGAILCGCPELGPDNQLSSVAQQKNLIGFLFLILLLSMTGCQLAQADFARTAGNAGSAFAAASTTLAYAHEGKITYAYAASSFVNYQNELSGLDSTLPSQKGAPVARTLQHLLNVYASAMQAVNTPCLNDSCDWRSQVQALDRASKAFLDAGGS